MSSIGKGLTDLRHTFKSGSWQNGWKAGFQPTAKDFKRMFKFINSRFKNGEKLGKLFEQIVGELEKRTYEPDAKGNERSAERLFKCEGCGEEMPASDTTRHSNPLQPSNGGGPYKEVETNDDQ